MTAPRGSRQAAKFALALIGCIAAFEASAAYNCNGGVSVTPISTVYSPSVATPNDSTGGWSVSCTRLATDANSVTFYLGANNGTHFGGGSRRVQRTVAPFNQYNYGLYRDAGFSQPWGDTSNAGNRIAVTMNFGAALVATTTGAFYMRVPQDLTPGAAGNYTDTVTGNLRGHPGPNPMPAFGITVITTNTCQIYSPPGNVNFTYTSFQVAAAAASTSFGARCTLALPYGMALDATSGTLLGLNYTLALPFPPPPPFNVIGTGATQTHIINGSIAGGQAGTCATASCVGSQTRTLTISW